MYQSRCVRRKATRETAGTYSYLKLSSYKKIEKNNFFDFLVSDMMINVLSIIDAVQKIDSNCKRRQEKEV